MITPEEAASLKSFKHPCTCGGYAWSMNGRNPKQPHMDWCPQAAEFAEWREAMSIYEIGKMKSGVDSRCIEVWKVMK